MSDKERAFEDPKAGAGYLQPQQGSLQPGMPPREGSLWPSSGAGSISPNPLGPPSSLDVYGTMMSKGEEGYDYTFEPPLESKYECPICLMCLREPVQTECGHRFCRNCITRSLRLVLLLL